MAIETRHDKNLYLFPHAHYSATASLPPQRGVTSTKIQRRKKTDAIP